MRQGFLKGFVIAALCVLLGGCGAAQKAAPSAQQVQEQLRKSYQTTAKVKYKTLESVMTIYKKPMNCAQVVFEAPDSLKDLKMTFYTDRVTFDYQKLSFDFVPGNLPGQAASKLVLSALNSAMEEQGVTVQQEGEQLIIRGQMEEGEFLLTAGARDGNILKLSIPAQQLDLEILNFKILE